MGEECFIVFVLIKIYLNFKSIQLKVGTILILHENKFHFSI